MARELKYADKATQAMLKIAEQEQIPTIWDRYDAMQPQCGFGTLGLCCRHCSMGPCRIDPFGNGPKTGICGATADTIAARHITRMIAAGGAAHSDHGRDVSHTLLMIAENPNSDYSVKSPEKLKAVAEVYGIKTEGKEMRELAGEVARAALNEFGQQTGTVKMAQTAPPARYKLWQQLGIVPRAIDREVVEVMHRTHIGVDADYKNIIKQGLRASLADGWGGSMIGTELSDAIFSMPNPLKTRANLGVMKKDHVNVVVHGHEPTLSDIIAIVSQDQGLLDKAKAVGAKGIQLSGICCTANEIMMRHGIPLAGSYMQQELALMTGVVDMMVVDVQCIWPGLENTAKCFHTKLVTTSPKAKMPGFDHIEFHEDRAVEIAKQIIEEAINNYPNRNSEQINLPNISQGAVAGFTTESVFRFLGGKYRSTYRPLNDAIIAGRIRGLAGVVGCSNPNMEYEEGHLTIVKELLKNDVLIASTGCNSITCAKHGLMTPEAAFKHAGKGLQEVCQAVGIPPVLHMGACLDNSRILRVLTEVVKEGGLGEDISDLPAAGAAPEWMSEKAVCIGFYFVASGVYTVIGRPLPVVGAPALHKYLTEEIEQETGGRWAFEMDPVETAHLMLRHIDRKRKALKLKPMIYPQPFKPEE
ncbi:MAG: anaerobic carbon-monoxide dehydrogenase catalytic subunit [Spirochaetaceae bacterium]|nr:MAG: anaerobic carbon-monoxide dehydrogenase catalytic subunit [Spirochaetaceae bacterium]